MNTFQSLIDRYAAGASLLRQAVAGMSHEQMLTRPVAGKWSTLECVAHLADFEPVHAARMKYVIALDRPLLVDADEGKFFNAMRYHDRDTEEELAIVETTRSQLTRILRTLPAEAAERPGIHTWRGLVTLADLVGYAIYHIPHHVKFIHEKRTALGC